MKIVLTLVLSLFVFSSCLKKQDLDSTDLGSAVSGAEVESKMDSAVGGYDVSQVRKNEMSSVLSYQIVEDSQATKRYQEDILVTAINESAQELSIDILFNRQDYGNSSGSLSNKMIRLTFDRVRGASTPSSTKASADEQGPNLLLSNYLQWSTVCSAEGVSCYNLSVTDTKIFVPTEMANASVCNVNSCYLDGKNIEFDVRSTNITDDQGRPKRLHLAFTVSAQLPFFSKVKKFCIRQLSDDVPRPVLLENCTSVTQFSYGQAP